MKYYSFGPVLSHNAVYNFVVGGRGLGKTYGAKKQGINDYLKKGDQFIYVRRYDTELKTAKPTFFADIEQEWPDYVFRVQGDRAEVNRTKNSDGTWSKQGWETMGFFVPLSKAQSKKSVAYPKVKLIIFDEFIIEKGAVHYLPQEAVAFNNFFSTVDRWKDKTRVLFLANSVSIMNPYFIEFDIRPQDGKEWIKSHEGFIVAHFAPSAEFATDAYQTRFGKFIKDTEYADYAVGSEFSDNNDAMVGFKDSEARYRFTLETKTGTFAVWANMDGPTFYILEKRPKQEMVWTMLPERMTEDKTLVLYSDKTLQYMRAAFGKGRIKFASPQARNSFIGVFNR